MSLHLPSSGLSHVLSDDERGRPLERDNRFREPGAGREGVIQRHLGHVRALGGSLSHHVISESTKTLYGWISKWNTTRVPNGTYTLQSVAGTNTKTSATSAANDNYGEQPRHVTTVIDLPISTPA